MLNPTFITPALPWSRHSFPASSARRPAHAPTRPARHPPRMLSLASAATEAAAFALLAAGTYYFILRDEPSEEPSPTPTDAEPRGIVGLSSGAATPASKAPPPAPTLDQLDTVGVDINDYLESTDLASSRRVEEELSWAAGSLSDLAGCDGILVTDAAGDVVWVAGHLVAATDELGTVPARVASSGTAEVTKVDGNADFPFLREAVRCVATLPVGGDGAVLVVASEDREFFGEREKRVAQAVCSRLASFLRVPPQIGGS